MQIQDLTLSVNFSLIEGHFTTLPPNECLISTKELLPYHFALPSCPNRTVSSILPRKVVLLVCMAEEAKQGFMEEWKRLVAISLWRKRNRLWGAL